VIDQGDDSLHRFSGASIGVTLEIGQTQREGNAIIFAHICLLLAWNPGRLILFEEVKDMGN
jgi:hypothetical protein